MAEATPDFQWSRFYYPQILEALLRFKAEHWPEHTETDPHDPVVQLLRLFALVGHQQAVRLDHVARELYLPTLQLRSSLIALASLVDYELAFPSPATVDVLADLNASAAASAVLIAAGSKLATEGTALSPPIVFEYDVDDDLVATLGTGAWRVAENNANVATIPQTDSYTWRGSSIPAPGVLWGGAAGVGDESQILIGNEELMFDRLELAVSVAPVPAWTGVRWEYYDDSRILPPDGVTDLGGTIRFDVSTLVGVVVPPTGLDVLVTCLRTGSIEWCNAAAGGTITTAGVLGQAAVSTNAGDYLVQTFWPELPDLVDGTAGLTQTGVASWTLPQSATRRWAQLEVSDGTTARTLYPIRIRPIDSAANVPPTCSGPSEASKTTWTIMVVGTQGQTVEERVGTTDAGSAGQEFTLGRSPLLSVESVTLDDGEWTVVPDFTASTYFDKHCTVKEQPDGSYLLTFGDGTNGKLPPATSPVTVTYRYGGEQSGNIGAGALVKDRSGNGKLKNIRNPRAGEGWSVQEATTPASLELARAAIPASLRTQGRAVTPADYETLAVAYRKANGEQIAARVLALQEGDGPKTVRLVCVGPGGVSPTAADLAELEGYFNGQIVWLQRIGGVIPANMEVTAVAFTPVTVAVTATVNVLADYVTGADALIAAALEALLSPLATYPSSTEYRWQFSGTVSRASLLGAISTAITGVVNITLAIPAVDVALGAQELPVPGAIAITAVPV